MKATIIIIILMILLGVRSESVSVEKVIEEDNIIIMEVEEMSILGSVLKVCGTIVEGTGKVICDCVEVVEQEMKEYHESEEYKREREERERLIGEIKSDWNKIKANNKELVGTFKKQK